MEERRYNCNEPISLILGAAAAAGRKRKKKEITRKPPDAPL
jgi:hypothetical protein